MKENRPDPDALLAAVTGSSAERGQGRLKVYLGMSAGVGKTYTMLSDAIGEKERGAEILAGYIEPHGRKETEALAERLERIPIRRTDYRGIALDEFDLDGALARKPKIILIDELAHTNVPGSRHEKRWQDVQELLQTGVDVWTTVNIQHLESLKDVVARITGIEVQETVPDTVLLRADEVELVDIPPDELLQRLREGKIYKEERVSHALGNFFQKGNLIALRELVLRHTAERVDAQLRRYKDQHGVREVWSTTERILVCVAPNALSSRVVRAAGRLAQSLHAELIAVSIESTRYAGLGTNRRSHATEALRLAESLGGETIVRSAEDVVGAILEIARERHVSSIVMGKPLQPRWREYVFGSVVDELIRRSGEINVHVIPGGTVKAPPARRTSSGDSISARGLVRAFLVTAVATAVGWFMAPTFALSNIIMVYLLGVAWASSRLNRLESACAAVASVLAFDFFFVPPTMTFAVNDVQYLITFAVMLVVALLISSLTLRLRAQTQFMSGRERRTAALYELTRKLAHALTREEIVKTAQEQLREVLRADAAVFIPQEGTLASVAPSASGFELAQKELAVAQWVHDRGEPAGRGTSTLSGARGRYIPLRASLGAVGVLGILLEEQELSRAEQDMCSALADQVAVALERVELKDESTKAQIQAENEHIRNALLSSVSHDLRTPLASIGGAASALLLNPAMDERNRRDLAATISDETQRLERILRNVLDVTRLESGAMKLRADWHSPEELIGSALSLVDSLLKDRKVVLDVPGDLPLLKADGVLLEQLMVNLLENAAKHTSEGTPIEIGARRTEDELIITVADRGPGIAPGDEERIFEKLYRASSGDTQGFGLGLAICRAVALAHGGTIRAENRAGGGAVFRVELPLDESPPEVPHG